MSSASVRRYWSKIVPMGCLICGMPAEIAHCHGGSIVTRGRELGRDYTKAKGVKLGYMDWLALPLCPIHHRAEHGGLDAYVEAWEHVHGKQSYWIDVLIERTGINVWALAKSRHG
jgi:hypothetical protein